MFTEKTAHRKVWKGTVIVVSLYNYPRTFTMDSLMGLLIAYLYLGGHEAGKKSHTHTEGREGICTPNPHPTLWFWSSSVATTSVMSSRQQKPSLLSVCQQSLLFSLILPTWKKTVVVFCLLRRKWDMQNRKKKWASKSWPPEHNNEYIQQAFVSWDKN